jgi:hypothetical protein
MSTEFERTKRQLGSQSIMITSWYDGDKGNWRASAPRYAHIRTVFSPIDREMFSSRNAAIDRVMNLLTAHFAGTEVLSTEHVLFL